MVALTPVASWGKERGFWAFRGFFRKISELSHKTMIIKERLVVVNKGVRHEASQGICALWWHLFVLLDLKLYRLLLLLRHAFFLSFFNGQLGPSGLLGLFFEFRHPLIEECSVLLIPLKYYLSGRPLDMQKLSCPSDGESLIKDHLDKLDSFLNEKDCTSVEILEYLFLCLAFYSMSLILDLLIIFVNLISRD